MTYDPNNREHRRELAARLAGALIERGFARRPGTGEVAYGRTVEPNVTVIVWTTIVGAEVRAVGKDAIRVSLVYEGKPRERGLAKDRAVHRVGTIDAIVGRLAKRIEAAVGAKIPRCLRCYGPAFTARSGAPTCAAICWERHVTEVAPASVQPPKPQPAEAMARLPVMGRRRNGAPAGVAW